MIWERTDHVLLALRGWARVAKVRPLARATPMSADGDTSPQHCSGPTPLHASAGTVRPCGCAIVMAA